MPSASGRLTLLPFGIVVELFNQMINLAADYHFRFPSNSKGFT
nr:MAG TPA: hypothetical protein [Caudoviricetes sp.]